MAAEEEAIRLAEEAAENARLQAEEEARAAQEEAEAAVQAEEEARIAPVSFSYFFLAYYIAIPLPLTQLHHHHLWLDTID